MARWMRISVMVRVIWVLGEVAIRADRHLRPTTMRYLWTLPWGLAVVAQVLMGAVAVFILGIHAVFSRTHVIFVLHHKILLALASRSSAATTYSLAISAYV
jgi:hypothetical protein